MLRFGGVLSNADKINADYVKTNFKNNILTFAHQRRLSESFGGSKIAIFKRWANHALQKEYKTKLN